MSSPTETRTIILKNAPMTDVDLDWNSDSATFKIETRPIPQLQDQQVLVKSLYFSNDASQRAYIQKGITDDQMYTRPVYEGEPMKTFGLGEVVESKNEKFKAGDIVNCMFYWSEYSVLGPDHIFNVVPKEPFPLTAYLHYLGATSLTAYFGLFTHAKLKAGETIVVSGAAGATGCMVVQIAKIIGARVIGIAGGPEKCKWVESLGAEKCVDYKDPDFFSTLTQAIGTKKADVIWDGVGGSVLDAMIFNSSLHGRVLACGSVAGYNDRSKSAMSTWGLVTVRRLTIYGFLVTDAMEDFPTAIGQLIQWVQEGKIKVDDSTFTVVDLSKSKDLESVPKTLFTMYNGEKKPGKLITKIADPKL